MNHEPRKLLSIEHLVIRHSQIWLFFIFIFTCFCWYFIHLNQILTRLEENILFVSFLALTLALSRLVFALLLREATRPIFHLISHLHSQQESDFAPDNLTNEVSELYILINEGIAKLKAAEATIAAKKLEYELERACLAGQVIHDIKSSLLVIQLESKNSSDLLRKSIDRISKVLDEVSQQQPKTDELSFVSTILHQLLQEKRKLYPQVQIELRKGSWHLPFTEISSSKLFRIFSNLIENSVQAQATRIYIDLKFPRAEHVEIFILDNGQGMTADVKQRILSVGGSYNKPHGNGLGLSWVLKELNSLKGSLRIRSTPGKGTVMWISFPRALPPPPSVQVSYVYLEDEAIFRDFWRQQALIYGMNCHIFSTSHELFSNLSSLSKDSIFCLDVELGDENIQGTEVAERLFRMGYKNLLLATHHSAHSILTPPFILKVIDKSPPWVVKGQYVRD